MNQELLKIFNIPDELEVQEIKEDNQEIIVYCIAKRIPRPCPKCQKETNSGFNKVKVKKLHTVLNGKKIYLEIEKRRLECKECNKVFTEKITGMSGKKSTDFFTQIVQEKSRNQDYTSVGNELGIHASTVMRKQDILELYKFQVPEEKVLNLGLDGKYLNRDEEIFVIGDVKLKKFIGVTKTNTAEELERVLRDNIIQNGKIVETCSMDMSKLLKSVVNRLFPKTPIVVDKFHVIKYANSIIDICRIAVEKTINHKFQIKRILVMKNETIEKIKFKPKWKKKIKEFKKILKTNPEIKILWDLKNRIHTFYLSKDLEKAQERFEGIIAFLDSYTNVHPELKDLKKTLLRWKMEILNHFIYGVTNAYIEGLNNRIETLKRKRFGFRNKIRFIKTLVFALVPISLFIQNTIFTYS